MQMTYKLLYPTEFSLPAIEEALDSEGIERQSVSAPDELVVASVPTVFVLDQSARARFGGEGLERFVSAGGAVVAIGQEGETDVPAALREELLSAFVRAPFGPRQFLVALRTAYREAAGRAALARSQQETASRTKEIGELTRIGMALATERDYNVLLDLILLHSRQLTGSDAGSLYLVERLDEQTNVLLFKLSQNDSRPDIPLVEFTIPLDETSIAGYVATTNHPLVIDDAYQLPSDVEYSINRSFDEKYGYRTTSLLTIPMADHKNEVIGVLQLINRKRQFDARLNEPADFERQVLPYSDRLVELVSALAGQAAVSIENSRLYEDIERLFNGFVRAAVTAIEQRDPTTFGHSGRVADMTVALAEVVNRMPNGRYGGVKFGREELREIRYAGLLHDFGKVGVREPVLVKAKKLYPPDLALIRRRYAFIRRTLEGEFHKKRAEYLERSREGYDIFLQKLKQEHERQLRDLDHFIDLVDRSNEPTLLPEGSFDELMHYAEQYYEDLDGKRQAYLADEEVRFLSIRKGSLDDAERLEIESHVTHTYRFLMQIPWTKELRSIPTIAYGHHEKLDGSGYPRQVTSGDIPVQTRMMTIADIYDALTASDRPYKRAVPSERALGIISDEVKEGMLDAELFQLFTEARVYERQETARMSQVLRMSSDRY